MGIWLITGEPGAGKSTAISKILLQIRSHGYTVGGMLTREVRNRGEREGFLITDISTEETMNLASSVIPISGPRVGKYRVDLKSLSTLGVRALHHAKEKSDTVVCDEIGPMELLSPEFRKCVSDCVLNTPNKPSICTVHKRLADPLIDELRNSERTKIYEVTFENREKLPGEIAGEVLSSLEQS